ncbi:MAG TPA: PIN domain-containing protein [Terriglobales bacterium]|nr:PIN domain-containing protein [Terriglobales bacterium]
MVLVDTSVWSLILRRKHGDLNPRQRALGEALTRLIQHNAVVLIGPLRQEILSGIRSEAQYEQLRSYLRDFPDEPLTADDYESAAALSNSLLSRGEVSSGVDALIAAIAIARQWQLFTTDSAFNRWARHLPLHLLAVE